MSPYASNRSKPTLHEWSRSLWGTRQMWSCIPALPVAEDGHGQTLARPHIAVTPCAAVTAGEQMRLRAVS
jgi:hypothetical protein